MAIRRSRRRRSSVRGRARKGRPRRRSFSRRRRTGYGRRGARAIRIGYRM